MSGKTPKATMALSATFHPWAECMGVGAEPTSTACVVSWECEQGPDTRAAAKAHAEKWPGHNVRVVTEKVDLYRAEAPRDEGGINVGVAFIVALVGLFLLGFTHAASTPSGGWTPDGRWVAGVAIVGAFVLLLATGVTAYRRRERADAEYTAAMEQKLKQDDRSAVAQLVDVLRTLMRRGGA